MKLLHHNCKAAQFSGYFVRRLSSWLVLTAALTLGAAKVAHAGSNTSWDPTATGGTSGGGTGNWDTSDAFWWNGTSDTPWNNANSDFAVFGGTAGTVTLTTPITAGGLIFNTSGYTIAGSSTLTLGGTTPTITANANATISANIAGISGVTFAGTATLTLSGANTYTGGTNINGGTVNLNFSATGAPATNILSSSGALTLGGGTLLLTGKASTTNSQTVSGTTLNAGGSAITLTANATSNPLSINLGTTVRNAGATLNITQPTGAVSATNGVTLTGGSGITTAASTVITATNGAAFATVGGTDWAAMDSTNTFVVGLSTIGGGYNTLTTAGFSGTLSGNADLTGAGGTYTLTGASAPTTIRSLVSGNTLALGGQTLKTGGILSSQNFTISGTGSLQAASAGGELVLNQSANTTTITSVIADNTTASSLVKTGAGTVAISTSSTYTGATYVNQGQLTIDANGGQVLTATSGFQIGAGATLLLGNTVLSSTQNITGAGNLLKDSITFIVNSTISGTNNNYTGTTVITTGTLTLGTGGVINGTSSITIGTINGDALTNNGSITTPGALTIQGGDSGVSSGIVTNNSIGTLNVASISLATGGLITSNGTLNVGSGGLTLGSRFTLGATSTFTDAAGTMTINNGGLVTFGNTANLAAISANGITLNAGGALVAAGPEATVTGWMTSGKFANTAAGAIAITGNSSENIDFTGFNSLGLAAANSTAVYSGTITPGANGYEFGGSVGTNLTVTPALTGGNALVKSGASTLTLAGNNSFSGPVTIGGGFISAAVIGNAGSNGSLGTNGTVAITAANSGLLYTGVGETTNWVINYNSASSGGVVTNNGTGSLVFSNSFTSAATASYGVSFNGTGSTSIAGITQTTTPRLINFTQSGTGQVTVTGSLDLDAGALTTTAGVTNIASTTTVGLTGTGAHSGTITHSNGGVVKIQSGATVYTTTTNTNSILGGWATFGDTTWAVAGNSTTAVSGLSIFDTTNALVAGANEDVTASFAAASGASANSLRFNTAAPVTVTLTGANVISSGGILETTAVGNNAVVISEGTSIAASVSNGDLNVFQNNTSNTLTISSVIAADGSGGLTKAGAGTLVLSANNLFTGAAHLLEGTVQIGNAGALGTGSAVVSAGATLDLNGITYTKGLTLSGAGVGGNGDLINTSSTAATASGAITLANNSTIGGTKNITLSGVISDTNTLGQHYGLTDSDTGTVTLSGGSANTFTGVTTVTAGILALNKTAGVALAGDVILNGGTLTMSASNELASTSNLTIEGGAGNTGGIAQTITQTVASLSLIGNQSRFNPGSGSNFTVTGVFSLTGTAGAANASSYSTGANSGNNTLTVGSINMNGSTSAASYQIGQGGGANATLNLSGGFTATGTSALTVNATGGIGLNQLALTSGTQQTFDIQGTTTINAAIIGTGGIDKTDSGTLILAVGAGSGTGAVSNFIGGTTITAGTLSVGTTTGLGSGSVTIDNGATLAVTAGTIANTIISPAGALSTLNMTSGLTYGGTFSGSGTILLLGTSFSNTRTFTAATGSAGALQLIRGTYTFNAANANFGSTDFQFLPTSTDGLDILQMTGAGTDIIKSISAICSAAVQIGPGTTLDIKNGIVNASATQAAGEAFQPTSGTTSQLTSESGTLAFGGAGAAFTIANGVSLVDSGSTPLNIVVNVAAGVTFNGPNTYTGTTTTSLGTLTLGNSLALQNSTLVDNNPAGALSFGSLTSATFGGLQGNQNLALGAVALSVGNNAANTTYGGVLSGTGSLNKIGGGTLTLTGANNSYTGVTSIDGGILNVATLALGGSVSSIGSSSNAATSLVFGGGTLQYTGSAAVTTDRLFTIGDTAGNTATLDASGATAAATMSLTGTGPIAFGNSTAHALTLTGSNTGANTLVANIVDQGAGNATSLVKNGSGTWVLATPAGSTQNTYSGPTSVNAGTLLVHGGLSGATILGTSSVNVANGAMLGGTGWISTAAGGAVTVASGGTLRPEVGSQFGLSIDAVSGNGTVNLPTGSTFQLSITNSNAAGSSPGSAASTDYSWLNLNAGGNVTLGGNLAITTGTVNPGDVFTIILNAGSGTISQFFGNTTPIGGSLYSYTDGTGQMWRINTQYAGAQTTFGMSPATFDLISGGNSVAILAIPEPGSLASLLGGFGLLVGLQRLRRRSLRMDGSVASGAPPEAAHRPSSSSWKK